MNATTDQVNFFIATLAKNDYKATEIHELLSFAWGEENVIKLRQVQTLARDFKSGERCDFTRKEGSGRPLEVRTDSNVNRIRELVQEDQTMSLSAVCAETGLGRTSAYTILTKDLGLWSVCARWVPHVLTNSHKSQRVIGAQKILDEIHGNVMVIDEKWLHADPITSKENNRAWVEPGGDRPRQVRRLIADKKFLIIVAMSFRCDSYFEVLDHGETVNAQRYIQFLDNLKNKCRRSALTIMHDNARPHTAKVTEEFIATEGIHRIPQPPYSPDMNLLDRFVFRNMESQRIHQKLENLESVKGYLQDFFRKQRRSSLNNELLNFRKELQAIIDAAGDYL